MDKKPTEKDMAYLDKWTRRSAITHGISDERLIEICNAERDGRCVVLPCKPSDVTVYQLRSKKHARGRGVSPRHVGCATVWAGGHYQLEHQGDEPCRDRDFGKTWFLTPEAAEAALKGEQHENQT